MHGLTAARSFERMPGQVTANEIAAMFGLSRQRIHQLAQTESEHFPKPVVSNPKLMLWDLAEVEKWAASKGREIQWRPPQTSS